MDVLSCSIFLTENKYAQIMSFQNELLNGSYFKLILHGTTDLCLSGLRETKDDTSKQ